jgi:CHAD domain-containing protein
VWPVRGYEDELASVRGVIERDVGFRATDQPLVDEAVRASGGVPGGIAAKVSVRLQPTMRADAAAVTVLRRLLEVIEANFDGTIADIDSEFLHDLRVSVRRSRAVQRELKAVFPPEPLARFRGEFKWLQQTTGDSRDLDVYVLDFAEMADLVTAEVRPDLDPLLVLLRRRRDAAHVEMARTLRSSRTRGLLRDWAAFLEELVEAPLADRPAATRPIAEHAGERIRKVYRRMVKMGRAIGPESPAEDYHELRKKGKELRYLLELFGTPLFPADVVKPMIKTLKGLQDVLGRHQDREVQKLTLRSLRDDVAREPGGPAALMAMGVLVEHLADDERRARGEFAETFAAFADKHQRRLVADTFVWERS